nr:carbon monoxide dehydrogenase catalytic subunit [Methanopyrus kandleri]
MEEKRSSCPYADEAVCELVEHAKELNEEIPEIETPHIRWPVQFPKCPYGKQGVWCNICSNGPCRITEKTPRGVCGATADVIVARNFLRHVAAGAACYVHCLENAARALKSVADEESPYEIADEKALRHAAEVYGLDTSGKPEDVAEEIAEFILEDIYRPRYEESEVFKAVVPDWRIEMYEEMGLIPGGAKSEIHDALVKTSTNLNSDPVDMLLHVLRLGLITGPVALFGVETINDILFGSPKITQTEGGPGILDPDYVNIMTTGHQMALMKYLTDAAEKLEEEAKAAGAKGIRIIGATCVGDDFEARAEHLPDTYAGFAGNNFATEALAATGLVDAIVSEFNCTFPGLKFYKEKLGRRAGRRRRRGQGVGRGLILWDPERAEEVAEEAVQRAIEAFKERRSKHEDKIMEPNAQARERGGVRILLDRGGRRLGERAQADRRSTIRGVCAIMGCTNLSSGGHNVPAVELAKEMIKRDVLVLGAGCVNGAFANAGLFNPEAAELAGDNLRQVCEELGIPPVLHYGPCLAIGKIEHLVFEIAEILREKTGEEIDIPDVPAVASAPQWLEEQALADASSALALGITLHVSPVPPVTGSELVTKTLLEDLPDLTGGELIVETDMKRAGEILAEKIEEKRKRLGI